MPDRSELTSSDQHTKPTFTPHIDGPELGPGWKWGKSEGYDVRRCTTCGGKQAWIWNKWVNHNKRGCDEPTHHVPDFIDKAKLGPSTVRVMHGEGCAATMGRPCDCGVADTTTNLAAQAEASGVAYTTKRIHAEALRRRNDRAKYTEDEFDRGAFNEAEAMLAWLEGREAEPRHWEDRDEWVTHYG